MTLIVPRKLMKHIVNCEFAYRCPQNWDALTPTADERVRHCGSCQRDVYFCTSDAEAEEKAQAGQCIAVFEAITGGRETLALGYPRRDDRSDPTEPQWERLKPKK